MLTGSPVNLIVSEYAAEAGVGAISLFEFALVGIPLVVGTIIIVILLGRCLLPRREPRITLRDFSAHAGTLAEDYGMGSGGRLMNRSFGVAGTFLIPVIWRF